MRIQSLSLFLLIGLAGPSLSAEEERRDWAPWERRESWDQRRENPHATYTRERQLLISSGIPDQERPMPSIAPGRTPGRYQGVLSMGYRRELTTAVDRYAFVDEIADEQTIFAPSALTEKERDDAVAYDRFFLHFTQNLGFRWLNLDIQATFDHFDLGYDEGNGKGSAEVLLGLVVPVFQSRHHNFAIGGGYTHTIGDKGNVPFGRTGMGGELSLRYGYSYQRHHFGVDLRGYYGVNGTYRVRYTEGPDEDFNVARYERSLDRFDSTGTVGYSFRPSLWYRVGATAGWSYQSLLSTSAYDNIRIPLTAFAEFNPLNILSIQGHVGGNALGSNGSGNDHGIQGGLAATVMW